MTKSELRLAAELAATIHNVRKIPARKVRTSVTGTVKIGDTIHVVRSTKVLRHYA
jgi:hypothetical protein